VIDRACFFGDSLTIGDSDAEGLSWPGRLCRGRLRQGTRSVTAYNLGVNGDTALDVAARWRREAEARSRDGGPGALVFCFGVNDACVIVGRGPQVPLERSRAAAEDVMREAKGLAPVLWLGPPPVDERINPLIEGGLTWEMRNAAMADYGRAYAAIAARLGIPFLDLVGPLAADARYRAALAAGDGLHPAADGYARIAEIVGGWSAWRALVG
jgi:lysophospholipase L1-like esterase